MLTHDINQVIRRGLTLYGYGYGFPPGFTMIFPLQNPTCPKYKEP
jgi:hypothetical protein